jgi:hypothetical protein
MHRVFATLTLLFLGLLTFPANALLVPGPHPAYLHALSDLRAARWLLARRADDAWVAGKEQQAINQIDAAIDDTWHAAVRDGKDVGWQPPPDMPRDRAGRFRRADEILRQVFRDLNHAEDVPWAAGRRNNAIRHVDAAIKLVDQAIIVLGQ